jgi:fumarylacetoacetate (FAA) hydrolase
MKLASLKGPGRDGTLVLVNRSLTRAVRATGIAATLQHALENWEGLEPKLRDAAESLEHGQERHAFDFQEALEKGRVAAPLPRAYEWLDGSAYLTHVERVRRARNDKVPESFYTDPLMYQGGAGSMMGPRDPIRVLSEEWGVDLEGEVVAITADVSMGASKEDAARCVRLLALVNDVSFRRLIPAELAKGFGFVNGKGANALSPVALTPDELGESWREGKAHLPLRCEVNGQRLGEPNAGNDATFSLFDLIAHAAKTRELAAGTLVGTGTISNADRSTGYACLMEARLVEQVEQGAAKTAFLRFGDSVKIEMRDARGETVFGAIEQRVEKYSPSPLGEGRGHSPSPLGEGRGEGP